MDFLTRTRSNIKNVVRKTLTPLDNAFDMLFAKIHIRLFIYSLFVLHILYFFIFFKVFGETTTEKISKNVEYLNDIIIIYICVFLIIKFHPFRKHEFNKYDGPVIFFCALFLLVNLAISFNIKKYIEKYLPPSIASTLNTAIDLNDINSAVENEKQQTPEEKNKVEKSGEANTSSKSTKVENYGSRDGYEFYSQSQSQTHSHSIY